MIAILENMLFLVGCVIIVQLAFWKLWWQAARKRRFDTLGEELRTAYEVAKRQRRRALPAALRKEFQSFVDATVDELRTVSMVVMQISTIERPFYWAFADWVRTGRYLRFMRRQCATHWDVKRGRDLLVRVWAPEAYEQAQTMFDAAAALLTLHGADPTLRRILRAGFAGADLELENLFHRVKVNPRDHEAVAALEATGEHMAVTLLVAITLLEIGQKTPGAEPQA